MKELYPGLELPVRQESTVALDDLVEVNSLIKSMSTKRGVDRAIAVSLENIVPGVISSKRALASYTSDYTQTNWRITLEEAEQLRVEICDTVVGDHLLNLDTYLKDATSILEMNTINVNQYEKHVTALAETNSALVRIISRKIADGNTDVNKLQELLGVTLPTLTKAAAITAFVKAYTENALADISGFVLTGYTSVSDSDELPYSLPTIMTNLAEIMTDNVTILASDVSQVSRLLTGEATPQKAEIAIWVKLKMVVCDMLGLTDSVQLTNAEMAYKLLEELCERLSDKAPAYRLDTMCDFKPTPLNVISDTAVVSVKTAAVNYTELCQTLKLPHVQPKLPVVVEALHILDTDWLAYAYVGQTLSLIHRLLDNCVVRCQTVSRELIDILSTCIEAPVVTTSPTSIPVAVSATVPPPAVVLVAPVTDTDTIPIESVSSVNVIEPIAVENLNRPTYSSKRVRIGAFSV